MIMYNSQLTAPDNTPDQLATPHYDTFEGKLVLGRAALATCSDQRGPDLVPLDTLLEAKDFPYTNHHFDHLDCRDWTERDYLAFGQWTLGVINQTGTDQPLTTRHIRRLHILGLGPSQGAVEYRFGNIPSFKERVGSPTPYGYDHLHVWTTEDFITYANSLSKKLGRKPTRNDYLEAFHAHEGPSLQTIKARVKGIRRLNEYIGYPNINEWDKEDYVAWGVRVLKANPGKNITVKLIDELSRRKRGPSIKGIRAHVTSTPMLQDLAVRQLRHQESITAKMHQDKVRGYRRDIENKKLPDVWRGQSDHSLLLLGAKYLVADRCIPRTPEERKLLSPKGPLPVL